MKSWLIGSGLGAEFSFRLLGLFLLSAVAACESRVVVDDCTSGGCDTFTPPPETSIVVDAGAPAVESGDAPASSQQRSPLCALSGCFPGFAQACGAVPVVDDGGDETSSPPRGQDSGEEGEDQDDVAAPLADGGVAPLDGGSIATDASAAADAALIGIDVSVDRATPAEASVDDSQSVPQACYVMPTASGVQAACAPAGHGAAGSACRDSSDCASALGCVEIDGSGVCRPFLCALPPTCMPGTFYQQAPLMAGGVSLPSTKVPICSPNVPCPLLEVPTPCAGGKVCAVVGQGATSCVMPGPSKQNEWCDESTGCGEGLVCALRPDNTQNRCLKLCHIDMGTAECPGGTCQGGNNAIPDGFGICVGDTADGG